MGRATFAKDVEVIRNGRTCQLKLQIDDGWQIEDTRTGRIDFISFDTLLAEYTQGVVRFPQLAQLERKLKKKHDFISATLDQLPEAQKKRILDRRKFLEAYLRKFGESYCSKKNLADGIRVLWDTESAGPAPHASSVKKWLKLYLQSGRNALVLGSAQHRKGNRNARFSEQVEGFCQEAINQIYMTRNRGTARDTYEQAVYLINQENKLRPVEDHLPIPKLSYIRALIGRKPAYDRYAARHGKLAATHHFRSSMGVAPADTPLSRVEVDHTRMDVVVVDEATGLPIGRPWLTLTISYSTKCIMGFHLGFEPPSHYSVAQAVKMSVMPKTWLKEEFPQVKGTWPMFGIMEDLVTDNGLEFHGQSLESACLMLGINISYCPRKTPWWKGSIERVLGTLNRGVTADMPGRTFSSIKEKGDQNPVKEAAVTLQTLRTCIVKWIVDYYHMKPHSSLGMSPFEMWQQNVTPEEIPLPTDPTELDAITGIVEVRKIWHYGIELNSLQYNSEELQLIRQRHGAKYEVDVRWNSENLGSIFVAVPDQGFITVPVVPAMAAYATGLSLYQHNVCKRYVAGKAEDTHNTIMLAEAKAEIRQLIAADVAKGKKKTRVRQHQMLDQAEPTKAPSVERTVPVEAAPTAPITRSTASLPVFQPILKRTTNALHHGGDHE